MSNAKQLLSKSALFEGADEAVIGKFLERAETIRFAAGEIPVAETTVTDRLLMIVEGDLQIGVEALRTAEIVVAQAGTSGIIGIVRDAFVGHARFLL